MFNIKSVTLPKWIKDKEPYAYKIGRLREFKRSEVGRMGKQGKSAMGNFA